MNRRKVLQMIPAVILVPTVTAATKKERNKYPRVGFVGSYDPWLGSDSLAYYCNGPVEEYYKKLGADFPKPNLGDTFQCGNYILQYTGEFNEGKWRVLNAKEILPIGYEDFNVAFCFEKILYSQASLGMLNFITRLSPPNVGKDYVAKDFTVEVDKAGDKVLIWV